MARHYVSNQLIHWTGRGIPESAAFKTLADICKEEILRLSYCPNYVQGNFKPESLMVCFTDIPLKHSKEHCSNFGRFGIAFHKDKMIDYGANPALYTTGVHFDRIKHVNQLLERMLDLEKDREWKEETEPYRFTEDETLALKEVSEFLQEYSYKNQDHKEYVTYYQREWRLTFNSLNFASGSKVYKVGKTCFYIHNEKPYKIFKFSPEDVAFLIVPFRYWWRAKKLVKKFRCGVKIYEISVGAYKAINADA